MLARFAQPRADRQVNREGRRTPHVIWDRFVKLKLHTPQPVGYVGVVEALDENLPGVRVVVGNTSRSRVGIGEGQSGAANDEGPADLRQLDALAELVWWCHGGRARSRIKEWRKSEECA